MADRNPPSHFSFTKRALESLPTPKERRAIYHDKQTRGLGIMVQPTGHRSFFWFRKVRGRPTWRTIGEFPALSVEQARDEANRLSGEVAMWKNAQFEGDNPFERHASPTFKELTTDYIDKHLKPHASRPEKAAKNAEWMRDKYLSAWHALKVSTIRKRDVLDLHARIGAASGRPTANRIVQFLRAIFYWGKEAGVRGLAENPAVGVHLFHETKRRRFLQPDELPRFFAALKKETNHDLRDFVNMALWTGARRSDVLSMRWEDLSLTDNRWTVPHPKNRVPYVVALTPEAISILRDRERQRKERPVDSPWVFPSHCRTGHVIDLKGAWKKLLERAQLSDLRVHDLRRTLGSWQAIQGTSLNIVGASLGHKSLSATQVYSQLTIDPVRRSVSRATRAIIRASKKKPKLLKAASV